MIICAPYHRKKQGETNPIYQVDSYFFVPYNFHVHPICARTALALMALKFQKLMETTGISVHTTVFFIRTAPTGSLIAPRSIVYHPMRFLFFVPV